MCLWMHWCWWFHSWGILWLGPAVKDFTPIRRHMVETILHLKRLHYSRKRFNSPSKPSTGENTPHRHNCVQTQLDGAASDTKDMEILLGPTPPLQGIAERPCRRYGLQEGASMKSGRSTGKEGKTLLKWQTHSDWTMCKFTSAGFPRQFHWFLPNNLILLSLCQ